MVNKRNKLKFCVIFSFNVTTKSEKKFSIDQINRNIGINIVNDCCNDIYGREVILCVCVYIYILYAKLW